MVFIIQMRICGFVLTRLYNLMSNKRDLNRSYCLFGETYRNVAFELVIDGNAANANLYAQQLLVLKVSIQDWSINDVDSNNITMSQYT